MFLRVPNGQLVHSIRINLNVCLAGPVEDYILKEFRLKHVVSIKDIGTELAKSRLRDTLAWSSLVHEY